MDRDGVTIAIRTGAMSCCCRVRCRRPWRRVRLFRDEGIGETLVIDDCSRDGSLTLLRQLEALYYDDGLRVLARATNGGLAAARNLAMEHARQRFVVFMDADNELVPETMPLFHRSIRDTGAAAIYGNLLVRPQIAQPASAVLSNESFQQRIFDENYIDAFAMVDRLQLLDGGGYSAYIPALEDYEQWLHLACSGRLLVFVPLVFGYYYLLSNSMLTEVHAQKEKSKIRRVFNQVQARRFLKLPTLLRRYHPAIGYI